MDGAPTDPPPQSPVDRKPSGLSDPSDPPYESESAADAGTPASTTDPAKAAYDAIRRASRGAAASGHGTARGGRRFRDGARGDRRGRGYSGAGPDARDPQPLGKLAERLVDDRGWRQQTTAASVIGRWEHLVGPEVAARCQPETLRDGELTVVAESTAWATQLRMMAPTILRRLGTELGPDVVHKLRVHGPAAPSWRKGPRTIRGRGPRDTYG